MRALYSPIAPIHLLLQLQERNLIKPYLLLLAHDILEHPNAYEDFLHVWRSEAAIEGTDTFLILDNGVIERGSPVSCEELLTAAEIVQANVVVGPDVVGNFHETKKLMIDQAGTIKHSYPMMYIPQGNSLSEIRQCIDWYMAKYPEIAVQGAYWGVPRWIANELGSRGPIVHYILSHDPRAQVHLLGMSRFVSDDIACARNPNVMGIDSANPMVMGLNDYSMDIGYAHHERELYWYHAELKELMAYNVQWMHDALSD